MRTLVRMDLTKERVCMIGLSTVEAEARLQQYGFNRLKPANQRAFVLQFLACFCHRRGKTCFHPRGHAR